MGVSLRVEVQIRDDRIDDRGTDGRRKDDTHGPSELREAHVREHVCREATLTGSGRGRRVRGIANGREDSKGLRHDPVTS